MTSFEKLVIIVALMLCISRHANATDPCSPTGGETGPATTAILKRIWCQTYTKRICFTVYYPLEKGVLFKTSQANKTYGADVSVMFYGKEVCIAYFYEVYKWSRSSSRHVLEYQWCRTSCFTGYKSNRDEKREKPADWYGTALEWESSYELIVTDDSGSSPSSNVPWPLATLLLSFAALICLL